MLQLNDDIQATASGWLDQMAGWMSFPQVGIVGQSCCTQTTRFSTLVSSSRQEAEPSSTFNPRSSRMIPDIGRGRTVCVKYPP